MFLLLLLLCTTLILICSARRNSNNNNNNNNINNHRSTVNGFGTNIGFINKISRSSSSTKSESSKDNSTMPSTTNTKNNNTTIKAPPILKERDEYIGYGNIYYPKKYESSSSILRTTNNPTDALMEPALYLKDPFHYIRDDDRDNPEIVSHLEKENEYTDFKLRHLKEGRYNYEDMIYKELLSHVEETDMSCSYYNHDSTKYEYYSRTVEGESYCYHCRRDVSEEGEVIYLNENELATGKDHCDVEDVEISPDHNLVAYTVDYTGDESYSMYIKNLTSGELLVSDTIHDMSGSVEWGGSSSSDIYYSTLDDADREYKLWKHRLGTSPEEDVCIYTEDDPVYSINFYKTRSGRFLIVVSESHDTDECYYIDLSTSSHHHETDYALTLIEKRVPHIHYSVDHHNDHFYIITNRDNATNFKLVKTPISTPSAFYWDDVLPYDPLRTLEDIHCFKHFIVLYGRQHGFTQLWIMNAISATTDYSDIHQLTFEESIYFLEPNVNMLFDTHLFRFTYSSMTTPSTLYDYDTITKQILFLKQRPCPNYNPSLYQSQRLHAKAIDGTLIPMSMLYKKNSNPFNNDDPNLQQPRPVHLYGYGSFGDCEEPEFDKSILPLLDRGVIYIIAHVRGGGEMGRSWYEDAKYLNKIRTFTDFIACAEHVVQENITTPQLLTIEGQSAGGLLLGVVLNMRPDLFKAALTAVPFVDLMNTMCDSTIPLTAGEWVEWGNPNESKYFQYMLSYSPYDNVKYQPYPNIFITCGLHDTHVGFWEPTKWVAKLRQCNTNPSTNILFKIDMTSGHSGSTDRYVYLKKKALDICFILDQLHLLDT